VEFTKAGADYSLGREGGHTRRRVLHAGDLTGREIETALLAALAEKPSVRLYEDHIGIDLLTRFGAASGLRRCSGMVTLDHVRGEIVVFEAAVVMLASGGFGQVYRHTTNPDIATGDGLAMAWRAGVEVANLEFVQFHPTALHPAGTHAFLISEAIRGEGAILRRQDGTSLMDGVHPLGSLAPRDIVARAIDAELKRSGDAFVLLDLSPIPPDVLARRFPRIMAECEQRGFDATQDPLPVVPAAHYACGGVRTDAGARTSLPGLLASGEVACTGVHGANRLASNSLLEAVVFSHRAAERLPAELQRAAAELRGTGAAADWTGPVPGAMAGESPDAIGLARRARIRSLTWELAGIVRTLQSLEEASARLVVLKAEVDRDFDRQRLTTEGIELRNLADTAALIIESARRRRESRGLHYLTDHPWRDNEHQLRDTVLVADTA
jgi:L-aspartate oxidase